MTSLRKRGAEAAIGRLPDGTPVLVLSFPLPGCDHVPGLTAAERDIGSRLLRGETTDDIACARSSSVRTLANQLAALYRKLGVSSRSDAEVTLARLNEEHTP
jgi:DNA-binding CsgD family transcriptional regulator